MNKNNPNYEKGGKKNKKNKNKNKNKNNDKQKDSKETTELDFTMCDFPIPYSESRLVENWFEFNDSTVTPIRPGALQSKFGGNSHDGNAYMLVYRQKKMNPLIKEDQNKAEQPKLPEY